MLKVSCKLGFILIITRCSSQFDHATSVEDKNFGKLVYMNRQLFLSRYAKLIAMSSKDREKRTSIFDAGI